MLKTTFCMILSTIIIAHRGGAEIANENTLSSFEQAIKIGVEMIELDVHMTSDGHVVVCHDFTIDRTTDASGKIEDLTLDQFKQAHIVDRLSHSVTEETMPTLKEVLFLTQGKTKLLIEIKRKHKDQYLGMEQKIIDLIYEMDMKNQIIIQSFDDQAIFTTQQIDPTIRTEKLLFCKLPLGLCFDGKINSFSFEKYKNCASLNFMYKFVNQKLVDRIHSAGFEVRVWTVNNPAVIKYTVDGIITNRPDLFLQAPLM